jgi:hypothetical protein
LAASGQCKSQQSGNKRDTFHFGFLGEFLVEIHNNLPGLKCIQKQSGNAPKIEGGAF